jgi:hypothetical protein
LSQSEAFAPTSWCSQRIRSDERYRLANPDRRRGDAEAELRDEDPDAGHTDSTGDARANQALSDRRAATVKRILSEKYGADGARITTKGWGPDQAVADNPTDEGRALNRRVEIVLN